MTKQLISIVCPVYNEAENISLFYSKLCEVAASQPYVFELVFVDDGSTDASVACIAKLKKGNVPYRLLRFSRNFGKEAAITAGLAAANGDAVISIDADMQHPIETVPEFIAAWQGGADIVVGVRKGAGDRRPLKRLTSSLFYWLINAVSTTKIIPHETDFRLLSREVVDEYNKLTEHNRISRGLVDWMGYDRTIIYFDAHERRHGAPKYSYRKLTRLAINTFVSYSFFPLRFAGYLGSFIVIGAGALGIFIIIEQLLLSDPLNLNFSGTAMLALVILFLVGVILACLGLFGLYIASIQDEATGRPLYIIRKNNKA